MDVVICFFVRDFFKVLICLVIFILVLYFYGFYIFFLVNLNVLLSLFIVLLLIFVKVEKYIVVLDNLLVRNVNIFMLFGSFEILNLILMEVLL